MYGVPAALDLTFLRAAELAQACSCDTARHSFRNSFCFCRWRVKA